MIEGRLEELVFEHDPLIAAEPVVDLLQRVGETVLPAAHIGLARVVGTLGEPDLQVARAGGVHDVDAFEVVVDRLAAHRVVIVGEAAEFVVVVLEGVGVDGAELHALVARMLAQGGEVVDLVPRDVQGDRRGETGDTGAPAAASAIFSQGSRGVPGVPKTLNRVPEFPNAQEGSSMDCFSSSERISGERVVMTIAFVIGCGGGELLREVEDLGEGSGGLVGPIPSRSTKNRLISDSQRVATSDCARYACAALSSSVS